MANTLGTLFQDIADAIRTKNGETGTMKPAEFPEKILGIESGGGGSTELYWKEEFHSIPNTATMKNIVLFSLNNELYAIFKNSSTAKMEIWKLSGEEWVYCVNAIYQSYESGMVGVELNGAVHIMGSIKQHYVFDGTTIVRLNDFTYNSTTIYPDGKYNVAVVDGTLYLGDNKTVYKYIADSDSIELVATCSETIYCMFNYNSKLYVCSSNNTYELNGSTLEKNTDLGLINAAAAYFCSYGDKICSVISSLGNENYVYENGEATKIVRPLSYDSYNKFVQVGDKIFNYNFEGNNGRRLFYLEPF